MQRKEKMSNNPAGNGQPGSRGVPIVGLLNPLEEPTATLSRNSLPPSGSQGFQITPENSLPPLSSLDLPTVSANSLPPLGSLGLPTTPTNLMLPSNSEGSRTTTAKSLPPLGSLSLPSSSNLPVVPPRSIPAPDSEDQTLYTGGEWSEDEDAILMLQKEAGKSWRAISQQLPGRSPNDCMIRYENSHRRHGIRESASVSVWGPTPGSPWSDDEMAKLERLVGEGKSFTEIAAQMPGRSRLACKNVRKRARQN